MKNLLHILYFTVLVLYFTSCEKEENSPNSTPQILQVEGEGGIYPENGRGFQYNRIIGYVYNNYQSGAGLQTIYEISDGTHYAYTTEQKESYGAEGKWLPTGKEFYTKKIAL